MIKLSVNVNKIATIRNSRGSTQPSPVEFAMAAIAAGAHGITVHPRPDERHIRGTDVYELREVIHGVEYNIEGFPDERYLKLVRDTHPDQATLVPDGPGVVTSNAGWDVPGNRARLKEWIDELHTYGTRVSLFVETDPAQLDAAKEVGADRIEFYTGPFAEEFDAGRGQESFAIYDAAARHAHGLGLGINAGHDLNQRNMILMRNLTGLAEVSIGHAIIIDALWDGWDRTIRNYLAVLSPES